MNQEIIHEDDVEVDLAGGWERIGAALLNQIFYTLTLIPFVAALLWWLMAAWQGEGGMMPVAVLIVSALPVIGFQIYQLWLLSQHGYTLGKKLLGIQVIRKDGTSAGFVHAFLLRELAYWLMVGVVLGVLQSLLMPMMMPLINPDGFSHEQMAELMMTYVMTSLTSWLPYLICLVMLFAHGQRRTLQDFIGGTVVIKCPVIHK